jgi:N-acetylmuramoyl-L-alanine amidase
MTVLEITRKPTDHFDERRGGVAATFLIIHYTETRTFAEAEDYLLGRRTHPSGGRVSVHYMIDDDGSVVQYVDEGKRAWHAGKSWWNGTDDLNSHSIGIELVHPGHAHGNRPFPAAQMAALAKLCKEILARNPIPPRHVLAHSDIAPTRKRDPGEMFDWKSLAAQGIGVWPQPLKEDFERAAELNKDIGKALTELGYDPAADEESRIVAFQRHFYPEAFTAPAAPGKSDEKMAARLACLLRTAPKLAK